MSHAEMSSLVRPAYFYICQQEALSTLILEIQKGKLKIFHWKHNTWRDGNLRLNIVIFPGEYGGGIISPTLGLITSGRGVKFNSQFSSRIFIRGQHLQEKSSVSSVPRENGKRKRGRSGVVPCILTTLGTLRSLRSMRRLAVMEACANLLSRVVRARVLATKSIIDTEILVGRTLEYHFCTILGTAQDVCGGQRQSQQRNIGASRGKLRQMEVLRERGFIQSAFWSCCDQKSMLLCIKISFVINLCEIESLHRVDNADVY